MSPPALGWCVVCPQHIQAAHPRPRGPALAQPCWRVLPSNCWHLAFFDLTYNSPNYGGFGADLFAPWVPVSDLSVDSWERAQISPELQCQRLTQGTAKRWGDC